jgi:hypothetical protein
MGLPRWTLLVAVVPLAVACLGAAMPSAIVTEPFEPKPVTVTLDQLPAPNTTPSVRQFPKMVRVPDRPRFAPAGLS